MHRLDSAGLFDVPNTESRSFVRAGRAPVGAATLGLAAVLALGAGEAAAQGTGVCDNAVSVLPLGTTEEQVRELSGILRQGAIAESPHVAIYCRYGRADRRNRGFLVHNPQIVVVDDFVPGIEAFHEGVGDLGIYVHAVSGEPGSAGDFIHPSPNDYGQGIFTTGNAEDYITGEDSYGIHARHTGEGRAGIDVRNVSVRTTGDYSHGVYAWQQGSYVIRREDGSVVSGYVWNEAEGFFERDGSNCPDCRSTRARGAVIVKLTETDRERDQRVRPLVATSGDYADAVRAVYTRAAARGHIAVTVEGYTLATGGIVPESGIVRRVDPEGEEAVEVSTPDRPGDLPAFDPSRPWIANPDYDSSDPNSPEFLNVFASVRGDGSVVRDENGLPKIDLRPYSVVYLPRRNPYYDPDDPDSPEPEFVASPQTSDIAIWNGRYFLAQGAIQAEDVAACQGESTAAARRACYANRVAARSEDNLPTGFEARGIYASHEGHGDIRIRATDGDIRTWGADAQGIYATHTGRTIVCGTPGSNCEAGGGTTPGGGGVSIVVTGGAINTQGEDSHGVWARHRGDSGADEADGSVDPDDIGTGNVAIAVTDADIDTAGTHARGVYGLIQTQKTCAVRDDGSFDRDDDGNCNNFVDVEGTGVGDINIAVTGGSITTAGIGSAYAVHARHENTGAITVSLTGVDVDTTGPTDVADPIILGVHGIFAEHRGSAGAVSVTVDGGSVATQGDRAHGVYGAHAGSGDLTVDVMNGAAVTTKGIGAQGVRADLAGDGGLTVKVAGGITTEGAGAHGVYGSHAGSGDVKVTIASGGTVTARGFAAQGVRADHAGDGDLTVEVAGDVTTEGDSAEQAHGGQGAHGVYGRIRRTCTGTDDEGNCNNYKEGTGVGDIDIRMTAGAVTAKGIEAHGLYTEHTGAAGTVSVSVSGGSVTAEGAGSVGVLAHHGADDREGVVTVTVGQGASVTGGLVGIQLIADADADGNVPTRTVTVNGEVRGVSGAGIHLPTGGVVNVGATGRVRGGSAGIISSGDHDADVTVAGAVTGDVLKEGDGALTFTSQAGGTVTGNVHSRGAGDLMATISGTITGDVLGLGSGDHTVTVREGGTVGGTIQLAASTVAQDGTAGRVWLQNGGTVTVGATGEITGVEVERDGATVREAVRSDAGLLTFASRAGSTVTGNVRGDGNLTATLAGEHTGDVLALGTTGVHRITVAEGGDVSGVVHVATEVARGDPEKSAVTVNGAVDQLRLPQGGGLTVGPKGRIRGIDDGDRRIAISAPGRIVDLLIEEGPDELSGEAVDRVGGGIDADKKIVRLQPADKSKPPVPLGELGTPNAAPRGPYDLGVDENGNLGRKVAPRARLYEALPAVMLGLNRLSEFRDRMAAPRDASGKWARMSVADAGGSASAGGGPRDASGGWARVHGSRGEWKADNTWTGVETSTVVESRWSGVQAGLDAPVGDGLFGISLHHRNGSATVSNASAGDVPGTGTMDLSGTGGGISGTWFRDDVYVDLQAEVSWYEADFRSSIRRMLKEDVSGYGYALGMEAGRRIAFSGTDGVVLIPRAGLVHSKVSLTDFTDSAGGSRVSLEDGRSLKGRMGVGVDVGAKLSADSESRILYSLDVEHEFEDETKVSMAGEDLASTAEATWVRAGVDVSHAWDDGRYTIQGGVSYATAGSDSYEYGGGLKLKVRF